MPLSPLDEAGNAVDWWFMYKIPELPASAGTPATTGFEYAYYDAHSASVTQSPNRLNQTQGALYETLTTLFTPSPTKGWILYNDESPLANASDNSALGHTKGVLGFDLADNSAFWLLHSWPKYANPTALLDPMPAANYGQTYLCLSMSIDSLSQIADQMITHQQPQVFDSQIPAGLAAGNYLYDLAKGPINTADPGAASDLLLTTTGGLAFQVIAKNRDWGQDFWSQLVAPTLHEDINVETWIRGDQETTYVDASGQYHTADIKYITLRAIGMPWAWPERQDHAKWGITHADNWICVGDINRMISQEKRGGCTIAFQDAALWALLNQTDLLQVPPGWTTSDALTAIRSTHPSQATPTRSFFQDNTHTTSAGHNFRPAISPQRYAAVVGTVDQDTENPITGRSGDHLQFYVQVGGGIQYQVDVNTQSSDGSEIEVYFADESLHPLGNDPSQPFGDPSYGVDPTASLNYRSLGLTDDEFTPISASRIESQLEAALNQASFVAVFGMVFDDGGPSGKGIHETHYTGQLNQDGAIAVYINQPAPAQPKRSWFFFKFGEDSID